MGSIATLDGIPLDVEELVLSFTDPKENDGIALAESVLAPKPQRIYYWYEFHGEERSFIEERCTYRFIRGIGR